MSVFSYPGHGARFKECRWASALHSRDSSKFNQLRSLDVRACNLPAIGTYKSLGFEVQQKSARSCSPPSFTPKITESHPNEAAASPLSPPVRVREPHIHMALEVRCT